MDRQCSSCGGFCKKSGCERENVKQEPVACQHKRYSIDVHEQIGNCLDCGAEGRMRFIVGTPQSFTYEQVKAHIQVALLSSQPQRTWVGLTDEDVEEVERWVEFKEEGSGRIPTAKLVRYIETKLKEKTRTWVGLSTDEFKFIASKYLLSREAGLEYFQEEIEAKLKEKNT